MSEPVYREFTLNVKVRRPESLHPLVQDRDRISDADYESLLEASAMMRLAYALINVGNSIVYDSRFNPNLSYTSCGVEVTMCQDEPKLPATEPEIELPF
jgi:hypothetical protein